MLHWRSKRFPSSLCTGWPVCLQSWLFSIETVCNGFVIYLIPPPPPQFCLSFPAELWKCLLAQRWAGPMQLPQLLCSLTSTFGSPCGDQGLGMCLTLGCVLFLHGTIYHILFLSQFIIYSSMQFTSQWGLGKGPAWYPFAFYLPWFFHWWSHYFWHCCDFHAVILFKWVSWHSHASSPNDRHCP